MGTTAATADEEADLSLALGGPLYQFYLRARLARPPLELLHRRIVAFLLITWLPLFILTIVVGDAIGGAKVPFLLDLGTQARLLGALPLLILGEVAVHERIRSQVNRFLELGLIAPEDRPRFAGAVASALRLRNSLLLEVVLLVLAFTLGYWFWSKYAVLHVATWCTDQVNGGTSLTLAGYWYAFVSLPILRFLLLRWYVRLMIWYWFLWRVSRIPLRLNPLHPDYAGGLGFLGHNVFAFAPVLLAHSVLLAGAIASQIWYEHATLPQFKLEIAGVVVFLMLLVLLPQTFFVVQLIHAKRKGRHEYHVQAMQYVNEFRRKWLEGQADPKEPFLGSGDIQSLADLSNSFAVVHEMRLVPFSKHIILGLAVLIVLPLLPLTLTMVPLEDMIDRVVKLLL
jgi:hypothetical protein